MKPPQPSHLLYTTAESNRSAAPPSAQGLWKEVHQEDQVHQRAPVRVQGPHQHGGDGGGKRGGRNRFVPPCVHTALTLFSSIITTPQKKKNPPPFLKKFKNQSPHLFRSPQALHFVASRSWMLISRPPPCNYATPPPPTSPPPPPC